MLAVSNTSPISNLAFIGHLNLLKLQFGTLWIPDAVAGELAVHPDPVPVGSIQKAIREQWIKTAAPQHSLAGHIPTVKPEVERLRHKAHFFIAPSLEAAVLFSAGE